MKSSHTQLWPVVVFGAPLSFALLYSFTSQVENHDYQLPSALQPVYASINELPLSEESCVECHQEIVDEFSVTPHRNTLRQGNDPLTMERLEGKSFFDSDTNRTFKFHRRKEEVWLQQEGLPVSAKVDWLFGSGEHAMTPVSVINTTESQPVALQHAMSWYPDDTIGWTLGLSPSLRTQPGLHGLAIRVSPEESRDCFLCHSSLAPQAGNHLDLNRIVANVQCTRCHRNSRDHLSDPNHESIEKWSELTPLESVNRCGECHRRADQFTPDELVTSNKLLIRFASASLVQSPCFARQTEQMRMDCIKCHDPHTPASSDAGHYNNVCRSCHDNSTLSQCTNQPLGSCVECHMPKVEIHTGLKFTDHWIRSR